MIALFDSGYGGLTVLKPILELLPEYDYLYLGDNARTPYGNHSPENIKMFSKQAVDFLLKNGAKLIIFACNTASSVALREIQQQYKNDKILGVLIPVAEDAIELSKKKCLGVMGTRATINSKAYENEIHKLDSKAKIYSTAAPLLVPFIEEDWQDKPEAISILRKYLRPLKSTNMDVLILGCTHYPLMMKHFKRLAGKKIKVLDSGKIVAKKLQNYLERHPEIESKLSKNRHREFMTTDDPKRFKDFTEKHFGMKISMPKKVELK